MSWRPPVHRGGNGQAAAGHFPQPIDRHPHALSALTVKLLDAKDRSGFDLTRADAIGELAQLTAREIVVLPRANAGVGELVGDFPALPFAVSAVVALLAFEAVALLLLRRRETAVDVRIRHLAPAVTGHTERAQLCRLTES